MTPQSYPESSLAFWHSPLQKFFSFGDETPFLFLKRKGVSAYESGALTKLSYFGF